VHTIPSKYYSTAFNFVTSW